MLNVKSGVDWKRVALNTILGIVVVIALLLPLRYITAQPQCPANVPCDISSTNGGVGFLFSLIISILILFIVGFVIGVLSKRNYKNAAISGFLVGFILLFSSFFYISSTTNTLYNLEPDTSVALAFGALGLIGALLGCFLSINLMQPKNKSK